MNNNILSRTVTVSIKPNKAALLLVLGLVVLAAGSAQAGIYTWTGGHASDSRWDRDNNWDSAPTFDNQADIKIAGTNRLDQVTRNHTTIKSLEFTSSNTAATQIGLATAAGTGIRHLTFSADTGNASLTVNSSATGHKEVGYFNGDVTPGSIILSNNLAIANNMTTSDKLRIRAAITGDEDVSYAGEGGIQIFGISTYTGDTTLTGDNVVFANNSQLNFIIGADEVNNRVLGTGTVKLGGDFLFDLSGASITLGDSWEIVDVDTLTETFNSTFSLASTSNAFTEINGVWNISENGVGYEFSENTGLLTVVPVAHWMSGAYGVGWRFRADNKTEIDNWDVDTLVSQVKTIPGVKYVIFNLSDAAHGDAYIAPHSVLSVITPDATPNGGLGGRDLFMEMAQGFQTNGFKVIAYLACQGPAMLKHGAESAFDSVDEGGGVFSSVAMDNWSNHVFGVYGDTDEETYKTAFGEVIVDEYAERYGALIDGWWFDNGLDNFDAELLFSIVKEHNTNVVVSSNKELLLQNDFLSGHPIPLAQHPASSQVNLPMLTNIETSDGGYVYTNAQPNLGHMFMAMGDKWNSGTNVWELGQAADWMERCIKAGGAWTWNVDLTDSSSIIRADMAAFMTTVVAEMAISNTAPVFAADPIIMANGTENIAYAGSIFGSATDGDGDPLSYTKLAGPAWLSVATNGTLSGTPTDFDDGLNSFLVGAGDGKGDNTIATLEITVGIGTSTVWFNDLRGLIGSTPKINGANITDPNVSITKATNGNDVVYSMSIINQNLDSGGTFTDALSWDVRVKGFMGGSFVTNGNDSSVTLGSSVFVGTTNNEFGISGTDNRFLNPGESIQFNVENMVLTADAGFAPQFAGFDGLWGTKGTYIYGEGTGGLESQVTTNNGALTFATNTVLVVTSTSISERIRDLAGSFTISEAVPAITNASFTIINDGGQDYPGMTYTRVITLEAYIVETSTNLVTASWIPRSVGPAESDVTIVTGPVDNADGTETLSFRLNQSLDANSSLFLRVNGTE